MSLFILKHRSTGRIMPVLQTGSTWWDPITRHSKPRKTELPRLFARKIDAENARQWWAKGPQVLPRENNVVPFNQKDIRSVRDYESSTDFGRHYTENLRKSRHKEDLEIIEVELKEVGQLELLDLRNHN